MQLVDLFLVNGVKTVNVPKLLGLFTEVSLAY